MFFPHRAFSQPGGLQLRGMGWGECDYWQNQCDHKVVMEGTSPVVFDVNKIVMKCWLVPDCLLAGAWDLGVTNCYFRSLPVLCNFTL